MRKVSRFLSIFESLLKWRSESVLDPDLRTPTSLFLISISGLYRSPSLLPFNFKHPCRSTSSTPPTPHSPTPKFAVSATHLTLPLSILEPLNRKYTCSLRSNPLDLRHLQ